MWFMIPTVDVPSQRLKLKRKTKKKNPIITRLTLLRLNLKAKDLLGLLHDQN